MQKGIHQKFEESYRMFAAGIFRYAYFKVSDYETARNITSDTFVRYWKALSGEKRIENHKAFLYFIVHGIVVDYYRKKKNKRISLDTFDEQLLGILDNSEDVISKRQELDRVYSEIKQLKKNHQDVLLLHYVEDLTIKEIAHIQNKQENAVRVLLHRALKALKERL